MATARARQAARQREINSAITRKIRSEEYLTLSQDDDREQWEKRERARANAAVLEDQKIDQLAARADRMRLRTDYDLSSYTDKKSTEGPVSSEIPYSVLKARREEEQFRRRSNDRKEQFDKDLERARALLQQERKIDNLELARDLAKGYGAAPRRSGFRGDADYGRDTFKTVYRK